ncbi:Xanthine phosphoribosyltransferase 1 [Lobosporangium transversale]|uniref:Stealth protein CR3 conserved region 3 domain-containing protein n=1 Tax=Lobosporangium transversale TaxID=64571 RepID=A0A1Y2G6F1_9FUNG|nr:hypothetical protein BCR41DRAFT_364451 [Lobosporangium transversale]KAF9917333.1 Xanthine phosphoribosyltransferase 1 [Lobosporangium transversale]ORY98271.1 hypothetical protein BCR41DRAFT_364451 [Lobosporangium transversale]|eukprot:XP_021875700.1 hypothetical protein BCR41DRAFT_364451 [Lobosporangium transversale]
MMYLRSPVVTNSYRQRKITSGCIAFSLLTCFFLFNWTVYHSFYSTNSSSINPLPSEKIPIYQQSPDWFAHWIRWRNFNPGLATQRPESPRFDIVYTWVNGSDTKLQRIKQEYQSRSPLFAQVDSKDAEKVTAKRFRDLDELRYSVRSVADYAKDMHRYVYLLTTEVDADQDQGQVPNWLDLDQDTIRPIHHKTIFQNTSHLPSFNSMAIESQMHRIPGLSDIFFYLNDDVFLGTNISPSDVWTPLYGFVFHMAGSLLVPPTIRPIEKDPLNIGEWSSLQYSNYLLSQRFGQRYRAYLAHIPHVLSVSILNEIHAEWPEELDRTSSHRFRGEGEARDVQSSFLMAHYVMEKLRETQLESYWFHRLDENKNGVLDWNERKRLILLVEDWNRNEQLPDALKEHHSRPTMLTDHADILSKAGLPLSGSTIYRLAGLDGYPFLLKNANTSQTIPLEPVVSADGKPLQPQIPYKGYEQPGVRTCKLDLAFCFGNEFLSPVVTSIPVSQAREIFQRLAFNEFHCGDCLLEILTQHPEAGISEWMPSDEESEAFKEVVRKVQRYNYILSTSDYSFFALYNVAKAKANIANLMKYRNSKAFFCINDDIGDNPTLQSEIQYIFSDFLHQRFPNPSPWEKS